MSKKKTHEEFVIEIKEKHPNLTIISNYTNAHEKILVLNKYGLCQIKPNTLISGSSPNISSSLNPREYWINQAKEVHNNYYTYENLNYSSAKDIVVITCPVHGDFPQTASCHLAGNGCDKCARSNSIKTLESFITDANIVHNNHYTYENSIYISTKDEIIVTCPIHGDFPTTPNSHLSGKRCKKCSRQFNPHSYSQWIAKGLQSNNFSGFQFYIIKCRNDTEMFFKIGKTFNNISIRYGSEKQMPYNWRVEHSIIGNGDYICHLEHIVHNQFKDNHYEPLIKFNGSKTECFKFEDIQIVIDFADNYDM